VICTLDEQLHVDRCVVSARELGPVFVVDGGSHDDTTALARRHGAEVIEHRWLGYADQKNWALENLPIKTSWVLLLDADEYLTPALRAEIRRTVNDTDVNGFYVPRSNIFLGRRLRHAWWYPDYQLRLLRLGKGRYEDRAVHEHVIVEGREGFLREPLMHENLKGIDGFIERQLRYAGLEAQEMLALGTDAASGWRRGRLFGTWPERRRALKVRVWYRMPGRPVIRFLWMYVLKRGFLDGRQGLIYSQLIAFHEALVNAKLFEKRRGPASGMPRR
jgi:glycosyltransferase involved in cell wall biosynthesis